MSELSARTQALLSQARAQATPTPEQLAHVRRQLTPRLPGAQRRTFTLLVPVVSTLFVGALLVLVGASSSGVMGSWSFGHRAAHLVCVDEPSPPAAARDRPAAFELDDVDPTRSCRSPTPSTTPLELLPSMRTAPKPRQVAALGTTGPLFREDDQGLALLEEARLALDEGRPFDALGQVQKHFDRYPNSQLHEERLAVQLLALCMARRPELATAHYETFMREFPESTYRPRVQRACSESIEGAADGG